MLSRREELAWKVRQWWNERIVDGCQLEFIDMTRPRDDWRGDARWKTRVALSALHRDFCMSRNMHPSLPEFGLAYNMATRNRDRVAKNVPYKTRGNVSGLKPVVFVRFGKAPLTPLPS